MVDPLRPTTGPLPPLGLGRTGPLAPPSPAPAPVPSPAAGGTGPLRDESGVGPHAALAPEAGVLDGLVLDDEAFLLDEADAPEAGPEEAKGSVEVSLGAVKGVAKLGEGAGQLAMGRLGEDGGLMGRQAGKLGATAGLADGAKALHTAAGHFEKGEVLEGSLVAAEGLTGLGAGVAQFAKASDLAEGAGLLGGVASKAPLIGAVAGVLSVGDDVVKGVGLVAQGKVVEGGLGLVASAAQVGGQVGEAAGALGVTQGALGTLAKRAPILGVAAGVAGVGVALSKDPPDVKGAAVGTVSAVGSALMLVPGGQAVGLALVVGAAVVDNWDAIAGGAEAAWDTVSGWFS